MQIGPNLAAVPGQKLSSVLIYPQDPLTGPIVEDTIEVSKIGGRVSGPRLEIWDQEVSKASADSQGNYRFKPDNRKFDQVQAFVTSQKTLDLFCEYAQRDLPWAFENPVLGVGPHAGEGANAYYQRFAESLSFYYFDSKALKKRVETAQSSDIVSHETGHAILDGMKPEYGRTFDRETKAFHEAFGDCAAMLLTLSRPQNCQQILEQTQGDLSQPNCLSRLGEEFGSAVRRLNANPNDDRDYLRSHLNPFSYVDPDTLPADGPRDQLSGESHSFCEVWNKSFYQILCGLAANPAGTVTVDSLQKAGQVAGQLLTLATHMASPALVRYPDMAAAMLAADRILFEGQHQGLLEGVYSGMKMLGAPQVPPQFQWSAAPTDAKDAQKLFDALGESQFRCTRLIQDKRGLTFVEGLKQTTRCMEDLGLKSKESQGLMLTFDPQGHLIYWARDPQEENSLRTGLMDELSIGRNPNLPATWQITREGHGALSEIERLPVFLD